jgi:hypothetical protein
VYVNPFTAVGKKLILLDACSILTVNKGVFAARALAVTNDSARTAITTLTVAADIFCLLSILVTSFQIYIFYAKVYINVFFLS